MSIIPLRAGHAAESPYHSREWPTFAVIDKSKSSGYPYKWFLQNLLSAGNWRFFFLIEN